MKKCKKSYVEKIRLRIRLLWLLFFLLLIYMVVVGVLGGGDSRYITGFADAFGSIVFFGSLFYVLWRIRRNKKLIQNKALLKEQMIREQDERNRRLHEQSGGAALDLLMLFLLFFSLTASMFHMAVFYTSALCLAAALVLKASAYLYYRRRL